MLAYSSAMLESARPFRYDLVHEVNVRNGKAMSRSAGSENTRMDDVMEAARRELVEHLARRTATDGRHKTAIPELNLYRFSEPDGPEYFLQEPSVYVVVQGRKQV